MGGKSTYIRSVAVAVHMAHIGNSYEIFLNETIYLFVF